LFLLVPAVAARIILAFEVRDLSIHTAGWEVVRSCFRGERGIIYEDRKTPMTLSEMV
jgi:hypothetical protein